MASLIINKKNHTAQIKLTIAGKRSPVFLGRMTRREAEPILRELQELELAKKHNLPIGPESRIWLKKRPEKLVARLIKLGLIDRDYLRASPTIYALFDLYDLHRARPHCGDTKQLEETLADLASQARQLREQPSDTQKKSLAKLNNRRVEALKAVGLNARTMTQAINARENLINFFGDISIGKITREMGLGCIGYLRSGANRRSKGNGGLAEPTTVKRVQLARSVFDWAIDHDLMERNPLPARLVGIKSNNRERIEFVARSKIEIALDRSDNSLRCGLDSMSREQLDVAIVLARFQAMTCPSEILELKFSDVNLKRRSMEVCKIKTGKNRLMPIFAESLPTLERAVERRTGSPYVISSPYLREHKNWGTLLTRRVDAAGLTRWPKIWQNLRASRCIELDTEVPSFVCAEWCGHSEAVAKSFYLKPNQEHFQRAISMPAKTDTPSLIDGAQFSIAAD